MADHQANPGANPGGSASPAGPAATTGPAPEELERALAEWAARPPLTLDHHVDRKDVVRYAVATGATDPVHLDPEAARAAGYADVVAPPMYYVSLRTAVFNLVPLAELHPEGTPLRDAPPIPFTQAMAGETVAHLFRPFVAGDAVRCTRRIESFERKIGRSGALTFVRFEYRYEDPGGDPYAVEHFTRIFR